MVLNENFKEFIKLLNANEVKYLVVGGFAVAYHGYPRYTKDIDFWVWSDQENAVRLLKAVQDFGFGALGLRQEDLSDPENVIQLGYEPHRIALIIQLEGLDFDTCFAQRQEATFEEIPIHFIGYDDLLKNKRSTGRLKDKVDVQTLERTAKKRKK